MHRPTQSRAVLLLKNEPCPQSCWIMNMRIMKPPVGRASSSVSQYPTSKTPEHRVPKNDERSHGGEELSHAPSGVRTRNRASEDLIPPLDLGSRSGLRCSIDVGIGLASSRRDSEFARSHCARRVGGFGSSSQWPARGPARPDSSSSSNSARSTARMSEAHGGAFLAARLVLEARSVQPSDGWSR